MKSKILSLEVRNKIYNFISDNPGTYPGAIEKKLGIPRTTLDYHLRFLERKNLVNIDSDGLYNRYYITGLTSQTNKKILGVLRKKTHCEIILYLLCTGIASQIQLCKELEKNPSTIASTVSCLIEKDILEEVKKNKDNTFETKYKNKIIRDQKGREIIYRLKNPEEIHNLILTYKSSLLNDNISRSMFNYLKLFASGEVPKKRYCNAKTINNFESILHDVFPHPYYC